MFNISRRANFDGGLLEIKVYETQNLPVLKSQYLPDIDEAIFRAKNWDVLQPSAERQELDAVIYDALGLTTGGGAGAGGRSGAGKQPQGRARSAGGAAA